MKTFNQNFITIIDQQFWENISKQYFANTSQSIKLFQNIFLKDNFYTNTSEQFSQFYNYESFKTIKQCINPKYIQQLKKSKEGRLNWRNLLLTMYIKAKIMEEGCTEATQKYYEKYYNNISNNKQAQLIVQNYFLKQLQILITFEDQFINQIQRQIQKKLKKYLKIKDKIQILQFRIQQNLTLKNPLRQNIIYQLNKLFFSQIQSIQGPYQQYKIIQQYPSKKKIPTFNFYIVKFQPDYNKNQVYITSNFVQKYIHKEVLNKKFTYKNRKNVKYCHYCSSSIDLQAKCKNSLRSIIPSQIQKNIVIQCGKVFCKGCILKKNKKQKQQQFSVPEKKYKKDNKKKDQRENFSCISCKGICQCVKCLGLILIKGMVKSFMLQGGQISEIQQNLYSYYRQKPV